MRADQYNAQQIAAGALTSLHITELVRLWQLSHGLAVDGMAGPKTLDSVRDSIALAAPKPPGRFLNNPMPMLAGNRMAVITSEFRPTDRPNHNGVDWFYRWVQGDLPDFAGDHGGAGRARDGRPMWVVPFGICALAAAAGTVQLAGDSPTGHRVWIDHGNGYRTGYFHLLDTLVKEGEPVGVGTPLGRVGDNPMDNDGRHLHFELSTVDAYRPMDPVPFFLL